MNFSSKSNTKHSFSAGSSKKYRFPQMNRSIHRKSNLLSFLIFTTFLINIYALLIFKQEVKYIKYEHFKFRFQQFINGFQIPNFYPPSAEIQISIVMPIFNRIFLINRSLPSAQNQMYPNIEIICVDDCSTEPVCDYIIGRMKIDRRIRLVRHFYNQGNFHARKNGVLTANGQYIVSLDSDDYLYPNSLNQVYVYAINNNADVVDYVAENVISSNRTVDDWLPCTSNLTNHQLKRKYFRKQLSYNVWKRFIRRSVYLKGMEFIYPFIKGKRLSKTEDVITLGSIFLFASNMYCTKFVVYVHYMSNPLSVEKGFSQPREQNKVQTKFTDKVIKYLYFYKHQNFKSANLNDMLKNHQILKLYNKITNIKTDVIEKNCDLNIDGFEHFDVQKYGYCVIVKK